MEFGFKCQWAVWILGKCGERKEIKSFCFLFTFISKIMNITKNKVSKFFLLILANGCAVSGILACFFTKFFHAGKVYCIKLIWIKFSYSFIFILFRYFLDVLLSTQLCRLLDCLLARPWGFPHLLQLDWYCLVVALGALLPMWYCSFSRILFSWIVCFMNPSVSMSFWKSECSNWGQNPHWMRNIFK